MQTHYHQTANCKPQAVLIESQSQANLKEQSRSTSFHHTSAMKFTALLFALTTLSATAWASSPKVNSEPRLAMSRARVSSKLARAPVEPAVEDHVALNYLSNAIRDASTLVVKTKNSARGMSGRMARTSAAGRAQRRSAEVPAQTNVKRVERTGGMGRVQPYMPRSAQAQNPQQEQAKQPKGQQKQAKGQQKQAKGQQKQKQSNSNSSNGAV
ncbi:hypothetical protein C7974DRAFT_27532 [Boeremia exigua]|uniref:uncharacterized protein n=1 Tax=Boeremia exigua TaxID=749465 RepID=UPI001E8D114A|nr:uncharacterized protein C7974DRAFT_27532 [Boeremia exigua]KAH6644768.1 hypothetical protein C7974DRAFT_27532 [Boeremia exigua]